MSSEYRGIYQRGREGEPQGTKFLKQFGRDALTLGESINSAVMNPLRTGEAINTLVSGMFAEPIAGLHGLAATAITQNPQVGANVVDATREALTYQPRRQDTQEMFGSIPDTRIGEVLQGFEDFSSFLGDETLDATNSPFLASLAHSAPTLGLELLGARGIPKGKTNLSLGDISDIKGGKQRGIFAGVKAKNADLERQAAAEELANRGIDRDTIWKETGWYKDIDDKWKWELDDSQLEVKPSGESWGVAEGPWAGKSQVAEAMALKELGWPNKKIEKYSDVTFNSDGVPVHNKKDRMVLHQELGDAYNLSNVKFKGLDLPEGIHGWHDADASSKTSEIVFNSRYDPSATKSTVIHELQHGIQERERFAGGGNPTLFDRGEIDLVTPETKILRDEIDQVLQSDGYRSRKTELRHEGVPRKEVSDIVASEYGIKDKLARLYEVEDRLGSLTSHEKYKRLAGEAEARLTQARMDMTPEQRQAYPPFKHMEDMLRDEGIDPSDLIVDRRGGGQSMSVDQKAAIAELEKRGVDYLGEHRAPERAGANSIDDMSDVYPDDIYDPSVAGDYYGHGETAMDNETARILAKYRGNPEADIEIYRAVPKGVTDINKGDWITVNPTYAKFHGSSRVDDGEYNVISKTVKAKDVIGDGNSMHEFGYSPSGDIPMDYDIYPVHAKKGKEFNIDDEDTFLDYDRNTPDWEDYLDDAEGDEDLARDYADAASWDIEPTGKLAVFMDSIRSQADEYGFEADELLQQIDEVAAGGGLRASELDDIMRNTHWYAEDIDTNEVYRQAIQDAASSNILKGLGAVGVGASLMGEEERPQY